MLGGFLRANVMLREVHLSDGDVPSELTRSLQIKAKSERFYPVQQFSGAERRVAWEWRKEKRQ
jgi:hypothetical protein